MNQTLTYISVAEAMLQAQILLDNKTPSQILWEPKAGDTFQSHLAKVIKNYPQMSQPEILKQAVIGFAGRDYQEFMAKLHSVGITDIIPPDWTGDPSAFGAMGKVELDWNWIETGTKSLLIPKGFSSAFELPINPYSGIIIYNIPDTVHPLIKLSSKEGLETLILRTDTSLSALEAMRLIASINPKTAKPDPRYDALVLPDTAVSETKKNILNGMTYDGSHIYWSVVQTKWEMNKNGGHLRDVAVFTGRKGIDIIHARYVLEAPFIVVQYFPEYPIPVFVGSFDNQ